MELAIIPEYLLTSHVLLQMEGMKKRRVPDIPGRFNKDKSGDHKAEPNTYGNFKKQRLDNLVEEKDGVALCVYFNTSNCNSKLPAGKKCKRSNKEFWHVCAAKSNKNDPSSGACGKEHSARDHK